MMKAAMLGTRHYSVTESEREILFGAVQIFQTSLQRKAGYVPSKMPVATALSGLPLVGANFARCADAMMSYLCGEQIGGCNARSPYLLLAWLLLDSRNRQQARQAIPDDRLMPELMFLLLYIACGEIPDNTRIKEMVTAAAGTSVTTEKLMSEAGAALSMSIYMAALGNVIPAALYSMAAATQIADTEIIQTHARTWCYHSEYEAWRVAQALIVDFFQPLAPQGQL